MSDIVERLREPSSRWVALSEPDPLRLDAADEIERLRAERDELFLENGKLANELGAECLRLRAALREIAEYVPLAHGSATLRSIARTTLEGK